MKQKVEVKDNFGNYGFLEFEIPTETENQIYKNRQTIIIAMEFARMVGILETLGNVPDGYFGKHKLDFLDWSKEFVENNMEEAILFFEKKLESVKPWNE
jgi:hypothetical protein